MRTVARALLVILAALAVLALPAPAAQPQLPANFEDPAIEITDLFTINVAVPVANQPLYRSLFISPLQPAGPTPVPSQPQRPLIDFMIHSVNGNGDGSGGTYENWVNLRGAYCGRYGWFNRATAVDSLALYVVSRASGYPKIIAQKISIEKTPTGWKAQTVRPGGKPLVTLEWRKDDARLAQLLAAAPWQKEWTRGRGHAYDAPTWAFEPYPNVGPYVKWTLTRPDPKTPQIWDSRVGVVRVTVAQDADPSLTEGNWMGLVPKTVEVPGMVEHYHGKGLFTAHRDTCPNPDAKPPPNGGGGGGKPGGGGNSHARCVAAKPTIREEGIGPIGLGDSRRRLITRLGKPTASSRNALGWCLRSGGALLAALNGENLTRAAATTHVPARLRRAHRDAQRIDRGLYRDDDRVYGVREDRVRFVLVGTDRVVDSRRELHRVLRQLGLE